ncbi:MAG: hypothetical protein HYZ13_02195 [Acidobacteria bacterium]|nr:hypothetical protein [Acidobacteriota bacterium]
MLRFQSLTWLLAGSSLFLSAQELPAPAPGETAVAFAEDETRHWHPVGPGGRPITDRADLRAQALRQWWGEWTPEFRKFILDAAAVERRQHARLMPKAGGIEMGVAAPATGTWLNLGPTRSDKIINGGTTLTQVDSGRPRAIVVDPGNTNVIYLATAGGGVWKTTNGGTAWSPITESLGTLSVGALAMDPTNSSLLYLGLGDPFDGTGLGIVKSTDGGATWGAVQTLGSSRSVRSVLVDPANTSVILVATDAGLYRSTDGGATYSAVASIASTIACWDVAWAGSGSFVLSTEGSLYYSTDHGATWTASTGLAAGASRISVASAPSSRSTLYAMAAKASASPANEDLLDIYKSTNGGATWTGLGAAAKSYTNTNAESSSLKTLLGGQGFYNHMILVDPTNANVAYFGGQLLLAKTTDGGSTFSQKTNWLAQYSLPYVHADFHAGWISADGQTLLLGTDGGIFKSTNAASTWTSSLNVGVTSHLIYSVSSSLNTPNAVLGGFQDNGTRVRVGTTSTFDQTLGGDGFGTAMNATNGNTQLASLYYDRIYKSTNGGSTWSSASTGISESNNSSTAPFITRITTSPADSAGNTVYTFSNAKVYKSTNFAGSWSAMGTSGLPTSSFVIRQVGAAKSSTSVVGLVASAGRVYLTANGGSSWTLAGTPGNNGSYMSSVAFDPTDHNVVYTASVAPDGTKNHLWKSTNFGTSWTAIDGNGLPSGVPVNVVTVDPGDRTVVYAATQLGLYRSADSGASWVRWGSGLPLVNVTDVWVAPDSSKVRVATYGRGFWELQGTTSPTAPSITGQPANATVTVGQSASFTVTASGTAPLSYQWFKNSASISGATSATYTTPATTTSDNGSTFYATVTNSAGGATSATATLTVNAAATAPSITGQPANATVNAGQAATFSVTASGTAPLSYQWRKNGVAISGATSSSYTTPATTTADNGATFSAVVTNSAGSATSNNATLTVNGTSTTLPEAESNNTIATANAVAGTITTITGNLTVSTDQDYFAVTLAAGEKLTVNMSGPSGPDWDLHLVNGAGTSLAKSEGSTTTESLTYTNGGASSVTVYLKVIVYSGTSTSPYTLALTRTVPPPTTTYNEVEPNNSASAANTVADNATKIVGYIGSTTDNDYFNLNVGAGRTLAIAMTGPTGSGFDYDLYFYNAAGTQLAAGEGSTTTENVSWTNSGASAVTVTVAVKRYAGSSTTTPYNLAITR